MDNRTRNTVLAIVAIAALALATFVCGGFSIRLRGSPQLTANQIATNAVAEYQLHQMETALAELKAAVPEQPTTGGEEAEPEPAAECPQARELGPWAPNNGVGETFEVTANEEVSAGVHVQLWWPGGSGQAWGEQEISVFIPAGLSIEVQDGAGRGWEYALSCLVAEIQAQMDADHARRQTDTSYWGFVDIDDLIATGLVVVRFDRR